MTTTFEHYSPEDEQLAMTQLMRLLSDEVARTESLARDLQEARETNHKYLEAIGERDRLIQEYIESLQRMRADLREGNS